MIRNLLFFSLIFAQFDPLIVLKETGLQSFYVEGSESAETLCRKMQAHLLIGDARAAAQVARETVNRYSHESLVFCWAIKSFAAAGDEARMLEAWEKFHACFPEAALEQDLLEEMCWGILGKGSKSPGLTSQLICLIGAALTQDMRAVPFILEGMRHTNAQIRAIAAELASFYGDHPLKEELRRLFQEETVLDVRIAVIEAIGKLKIDSLLPHLVECVASLKSTSKEKLAAIEAVISMSESIGEEELSLLASSSRAGLRRLACEVIAHCEIREADAVLQRLVLDPQPEVAASAIKCWGLLRKTASEEIKKLANEALDPLVGVTAAWVLMLEAPELGAEAMSKWLKSKQPSARALAASAVAAAGPYGIDLAKKTLQETDDPYVQVNLAMALVGQREECDLACEIIERVLKSNQEKWMMTERGLFHTLERSNVAHKPSIANYPEVVNQSIRLELLNILAILESPGALDSIKCFLKERQWGVTGLAAETLLGEGDENAIDLVRELLEDSDPDIRLEAALVLAAWGKDRTAVPYLLALFPKADRPTQLKILESLGRIGDKSVIPFLIERLYEPSLLLRMIAASVLIQTLNH